MILKINLKNLSRAQFSKLRNRINAVGEFRYDTIIMQPKFRINRITGLEIVRGGDQNFTHTHTHTHTDIHTPAAHFISFFFKKETRLKIVYIHNCIYGIVFQLNTKPSTSFTLSEMFSLSFLNCIVFVQIYTYICVSIILYLYYNFVLYIYMQLYYDELDQCLYIAIVLRPLKLVSSPLSSIT